VQFVTDFREILEFVTDFDVLFVICFGKISGVVGVCVRFTCAVRDIFWGNMWGRSTCTVRDTFFEDMWRRDFVCAVRAIFHTWSS